MSQTTTYDAEASRLRRAIAAEREAFGVAELRDSGWYKDETDAYLTRIVGSAVHNYRNTGRATTKYDAWLDDEQKQANRTMIAKMHRARTWPSPRSFR